MPNKEQAEQFALMLQAGMTAGEAIRYFFPEEAQALAQAERWSKSAEVARAIVKFQGKSWQAMAADERIQTAMDLHYNQLAWFLYSRNYAELSGPERQKADICRQALEAKLAGTAGKLDPLSRFWDDVRSGRVKLNAAPLQAVPDARQDS